MEIGQGRQVVFGPFRLDPLTHQLWRGEQAVALRPKPLAVLCYLAARPRQVVSKQELLKAVWAGTYVTQAVLKVCVRTIREVLEDDATVPRYLETVGRAGYRWCGEGATEEVAPAAATTDLQQRWIVGRTRELAHLQHWLRKAEGGTRQLIFLTGEPGVGKTTVVDEFLRSVRAGNQVRIGRGQCIEQHGPGEAYLPVLEAVGQVCHEPGGERVMGVLRQYAPSWLVQLPAVVGEDERQVWAAQGQGATRERMLREMAEALEALTAERSLVLVLEDLQWSDYSTLELLGYVAQRRERARLLVLGTYRPAELVVSRHPLKGLKQELQAHGQCEELRVELLTAAEVTAYITERFAAMAATERLGPLIHHHTEGNALFMVNVVEELISQGIVRHEEGGWHLSGDVQAVGTPANVQQLIGRQVERLGEEAQRILEAASVTGREFTVAAVAAGLRQEPEVVEELCEEIAWQGHFLEETGIAEWPDGTVSGQYQFRHALYQQVLYARMAEARRVRLHRLIGEREESGYGERAQELAAELAVHFERGRDYGRAVRYRQYAAQTATQRCAYQEALRHLTTGLELLQRLPATAERTHHELQLQLSLGAPLMAAKGWATPELGACYARARTLCQQVGETLHLFPVLYGLWVFHYTRAELHTARELAEQLLILAESRHEDALLMEAHHVLGNTLHRQGELAAARTHLEQGLAFYDPQQHCGHTVLYGLDDGVAGLGYTALVLWALGYPDQARQRTHEMLTLTRECAHPVSLAWAWNAAAWHHQFRREACLTQERAEAGLGVCTEYGLVHLSTVGTILRGWALARQGKEAEGIVQMHQGLTASQDTGAEIARPRYLALLAEAYGQVGQVAESLALLAEALGVAQHTGERFYEAEFYRLIGELTLRSRGQRTPSRVLKPPFAPRTAQREAEACFHKAIDTARNQSAKSLELRVVMSLCRLWHQQGKNDEARQLLAEIYGWFTEGFETKDLQEAKALLDELT